jgi:uncharacterized damage-inducible protein DinB
MTQNWIRPAEGDYLPYQKSYIDLVKDGNLIHQLEENRKAFAALLVGLTEQQSNHAYAPGKWTVKQVVNHINDCERIMAYRALCFARGEQQSLPGFEQDDYVANADVERRLLRSMVDEYLSIRQATLTLLESFSQADLAKRGTANNASVTVNALCWVIAGHELYHMQILHDRYL